MKTRAPQLLKRDDFRRPANRKTIAVVGNPNTGKSTLFNSLSGARQRIANYPGVTVDQKVGRLELAEGFECDLVDLPGSYSLKAISPDEQVAADAIMGRIASARRPDLLLLTVDATNLQRNLFLFSQLSEVGLPVVVALTMVDVLADSGISLNLEGLQKELGVPTIGFDARDRASVENLRKLLARQLQGSGSARLPKPPANIYPPGVKKSVEDIIKNTATPLTRFEAASLLFYQNNILEQVLKPDEVNAIDEIRKKWQKKASASYEQINNNRYKWARTVVSKVEKRSGVSQTLVNKIDAILTHKVLGLGIFIGVMYLVFQAIYTWATPLMDGIEWVFGYLSESAGSALVDMPTLASLISDGIIGGVGSVVVFLPQIIILFAFIALLEASGYLSRASFLMDGLLSWTGLNGRSFIPMLSSFACAIPGVMAARVMPDARARLTTILISPLMSCSARLPVYLLLISTFVEPVFGVFWAGFTLFAMHGLGLVVALPLAWLLNKRILRTPSLPFVLEMPPYRLPRMQNLWYRVFEAARKFTVRAGTIIFALSIVIWFLSYFPRDASVEQQVRAQNQQVTSAVELENKITAAYLEQSYLGRMGKFLQPVFAPLGYDWKITVGIVGAFPAREVIIATLGIIYNVGSDVDEESGALKEKMQAATHEDGRPVYSPLVALSLMIFFALCAQCMSTIATVQRELKSTRWAAFLFFYMTGLAYVFALVFYQAGLALGFS